MDNTLFVFGPFRLHSAERLLLEDGKPLRLGSRPLDILITLVEHAGETVLKDQLIKRVWLDMVVNESALRVHVAALRKALGDGHDGNRFIANIPGRGYRFVAPVTRRQRQEVAPPSRPVSGNLPMPLTRVIGRSNIIAAAVSRLSQRRLLTIVGPGGIGKTTVALVVAEATSASYPDGVWFVGLSTIIDPALVPGALGATLGILPSNIDPLTALAAWLRDKHLLIVLDCCEHVVSAAAAIAEAVLGAAPGVRILATSREPLRAAGEWLLRLPSLEVPSGAAPLSANEALRYSAVELFNERAVATTEGFALSDNDVPDALEICRRLDGMPLALELAAAQLDVFGIKGLAEALEDRLAVLMRGRRTALPRHQTLRTTIDWSYDLLPPAEQAVLRRAAVFTGDFTLGMADAVYAADGLTPADVLTAIANLVTKSLIAADISGEVPSYRLLDTTRAYAIEKLTVSGELDRVRRLHAEAIRDLFRQANAEVATGATDEWREKYGPQVGNLRSALDWAFSPGGDATLGVSIAAAATNSWIALALLSECCYWGARAIAKLGTADRTHDNMVLRCGVGLALLLSKGPTPQAYDSLTEARALSESLDDTTCQLRAIYGLWLLAIRAAKFRESLAIGRQYAVLAETFWDGVATPMAGHMLGISRFCLGENASAAVDLEQASATSARSGDAIHLGVDLRPITLCYQALTYWVLGFVERSLQIGQQAIKEAHVANHRVSLCIVLGLFSSIVLVRIGALETAERCIDEVTDIAERHSLVPYQALGLCAKGSLLVARGDSATADQLLDRGLAHMREVALSLYTTIFLSERASVLGSLGQIEKGLAEIEVAEFQAAQSNALWCMPEVLRVKGELLVRHGGAKEAEVEQCFLQSLGWARRQKALSWELRASISLAHFWRDRDRAAEASELVSRVYRRFTEGFETTDLQKAKTLLDALA